MRRLPRSTGRDQHSAQPEIKENPSGHTTTLEVTCEMDEALIKRGNLDEADARDLDCVGEATAAAARRGLDLTT